MSCSSCCKPLLETCSTLCTPSKPTSLRRTKRTFSGRLCLWHVSGLTTHPKDEGLACITYTRTRQTQSTHIYRKISSTVNEWMNEATNERMNEWIFVSVRPKKRLCVGVFEYVELAASAPVYMYSSRSTAHRRIPCAMNAYLPNIDAVCRHRLRMLHTLRVHQQDVDDDAYEALWLHWVVN